MPGVSHGEQKLSIDPTFASAIHAIGFRSFNPFPLTLFDESPLQLRHHAQDGHDDSACFAACRYMRIEHGHESFALVALVNDVEDIPGIATESIEARHH